MTRHDRMSLSAAVFGLSRQRRAKGALVLAVTLAQGHPINRCRQNGWHRVAFVGLSKHAGKTTALNQFIVDAETAGETAGLCSIGLDGEKLDSIMGIDKPRIYAPVGTVLVSAERALEASEAKFEWIEELPISSPLGPVILVRVVIPGDVVLAGIRGRSHIEQVVPRLQAMGARWIFVDGAFNRIASAAPHLVDAVVLAVGGVAGRTERDVIAAARPFIAKFLLPTVSNPARESLASAVLSGEVGWMTLKRPPREDSNQTADIADAHEAHEAASASCLSRVPAHQALFGLRSHPAWYGEVDTVYVPGAVTDSLLADLSGHSRALELVARHPAQVMAGESAWSAFTRAGHRLTVWQTVPIAGIAVNPYHVQGHWLDRQRLMEAIQEFAGDVPVYDAMTGSASSTGRQRGCT